MDAKLLPNPALSAHKRFFLVERRIWLQYVVFAGARQAHFAPSLLSRSSCIARTESIAIDELYAAHAKTVFNLALHYTQSVPDAEEITQDVFIKLFERGEQFRGEASSKTYLSRIAVNASLDFLRHRSRAKRGGGAVVRTLDDSQHNAALHDFHHPGYALEQQEAVAGVYAALNQLPPNQKTAIILLKIEGRSQRETAEIMETSIKAVESLFQRGRRKLAELLAARSEGKDSVTSST